MKANNMKAKKMIQKLTLLTFSALLVAFLFSACSDVTSPNEGLSGSELISKENDRFEDARRRAIAAAEAAAENTCSNGNGTPLNYIDWQAETPSGFVSYNISGNLLTVTWSDIPAGWSITRTAVFVGKSITPIVSGGGSLKAINQFPYIEDNNSHPLTSKSMTIDISSIGFTKDDPLIVVAHIDIGPLNSNGTNVTGGGGSRKSGYGGNAEGGQQGNFFRYFSDKYDPCSTTGTFSGAN